MFVRRSWYQPLFFVGGGYGGRTATLMLVRDKQEPADIHRDITHGAKTLRDKTILGEHAVKVTCINRFHHVIGAIAFDQGLHHILG